MAISKRNFLRLPLVAMLGAESVSNASDVSSGISDNSQAPKYDLDVTPGRFQPTVESLKTYQTPEWFRDAKFGIWAHWGPQAVPRMGDWYARFMYVPGHPHYDHHL
ncbi:MAG TPA: alpha-L-fucosidase, partial [Steroidobacteraceae bacterium]|nr:alpha-L-fucosidase [Steroidobacteraceae bacterium]